MEGPSVRFRGQVHRAQKSGVNGHNDKCPYVPLSVLKKHWTIETVEEILKFCSGHESASGIIDRFLCVFSTLVYVGQPNLISLFIRKDYDDLHLPISEPPLDWPPVLEEFLDKQWMFCPLEFSDSRIYKRELPTRRILPVTYHESLRNNSWSGEGPSIQRVDIHPECSTMADEDNHVVFKIYQGPDMEPLYKAEADVYSKLSGMKRTQKNITKHYGSFSFEETETRVIILEYAAKGSLLDFFNTVPPPVTPEESLMFWREIMKLVEALYVFQTLNRPPIEGSSTSDSIVAIHQDIQPANILVFPHPPKSQEQKESRFDVRFKLADFGFAELRRVSNPDEEFNVENEGSSMYGAPECYPNHAIQREVRPKVTTKVDVWSLGAVFSDAFVWSLSGEDGREEYRKCRGKAIAELDHIKAKGFEACFHNGEDVLDVVPDFHAKVLQNKRVSDRISKGMSTFILSEMLTHVDSRICAHTLMNRKEKVIAEAQRKLLQDSSSPSHIPPHRDTGGMSPSTEDTTVPTHHHSRHPPSQSRAITPPPTSSVTTRKTTGKKAAPMSRTRRPVPIDVMHGKLEMKRSQPLSCWLPWSMFYGTRAEIISDLQEIRSKIKDYNGRVQIILIDNFTSMEPYVDQVTKTAGVISYITKVASKKPTLLFFASDSTKPHKCSSSTQVESQVRGMKVVEGTCSMKICLGNILKAVLNYGKNSIKPTSIYVCTDGVWETGANDVKDVIRTSIGHLVRVGADPSTLMFQFIQFGDDAIGTDRLQELDDDCKEKHNNLNYDIVDTKRWDDEVYRIVVGSITESNDDELSTAPGET